MPTKKRVLRKEGKKSLNAIEATKSKVKKNLELAITASATLAAASASMAKACAEITKSLSAVTVDLKKIEDATDKAEAILLLLTSEAKKNQPNLKEIYDGLSKQRKFFDEIMSKLR